jgi:hypothetical protein
LLEIRTLVGLEDQVVQVARGCMIHNLVQEKDS